jgi:hypothetical protein
MSEGNRGQVQVGIMTGLHDGQSHYAGSGKWGRFSVQISGKVDARHKQARAVRRRGGHEKGVNKGKLHVGAIGVVVVEVGEVEKKDC